jgi:putative MATE family efflux protein
MSANRMQRDFTQGSIPRHLIAFSAPMFAGSMLQALYNTVDSVWVGRFLGPMALGAVSITFPLIMALLSLVMGLTTAATTLVAQYRGAGDEAKVQRAVSTALIMLAVLGALFSALGAIFRYPLVDLVQPPAEIRDQAAAYFGIFMAGVLGMFLYNVLSAILRGLGDSRTPLTFLAIAAVTNIVLDPLFIFGVGPFPKMGVAGAALATIISQALSAVLLWRHLRRHTALLPASKDRWVVDWPILKLIVRIGLPSGLQQALVSFAMVAVTAIISNFGPEVVAAFGAGSRLDQFGFMPAMSIGIAISAVAGQNMGAGRFDRVASAVRWSAGLAAGLTALVTAVAMLRPNWLMGLFTDDPKVLEVAAGYLWYMGPTYIPFALMFVYGGVIRGAGDSMPPLIFSVIALWGARVPLAYFLSRSMGANGIWLGIGLSATLGVVMHYVYYATGRWKRKVIAGRSAVTPETLAAD